MNLDARGYQCESGGGKYASTADRSLPAFERMTQPPAWLVARFAAVTRSSARIPASSICRSCAALACFASIRRHLMLITLAAGNTWNYEYDVWASLAFSFALAGAKLRFDREHTGGSHKDVVDVEIFADNIVDWFVALGS